MRLTRAEISLLNLKYNYLNIRKKVGNLPILAVVKADAYGHGMIKVVTQLETLSEKKPVYYGVALLEEALELRKEKITSSPILVFAPLKIDEIIDYQKNKIIPTVASINEINKLKKYKFNKKFRIQINIDTGMGRVGIPALKAADLIAELCKNKMIQIDGIYTHFATSDEKDKMFAQLQLLRFNNAIKLIKEKNINTGIIHSANSAAILDIPESYFDMVRVGISLYGYYPSSETSESIKLKPVMSLISEVATINNFPKGTPISYGRRYKTKEDTQIISVPIGYADGINRGLTNKMFCIIRDKKYPQVGTVTMDRIMFDVGNASVKYGDKVILVGTSKNEKITAIDWCNILKTIPYEITCGISKRVPRVYI
ncbi:MAG: alanine racemase [Bacteroidetes bacterium]|nr:alanine racemase [Bacteroidota bacterium]